MLAQLLALQTAMADYTRQISTHPPKHQLLHNLSVLSLTTSSLLSHVPIPNAATVFTDGSGKTHQPVCSLVCDCYTMAVRHIHVIDESPQIVELAAVAFQIFSERKLNIITASLYVTGIIQQMKDLFLRKLTTLLCLHSSSEFYVISHRTLPYFIMHIRSHSKLPGPLTEGNRKADQATVAFATPQLFQQA